MRKFRVALVAARFTLFDAQMPPDFPARMRAVAAGFAQRLGQRFDVVYPGLIETEADAERVAAQLAGEALDLLVLAPTMAVAPAFFLPSVCRVEVPVLIWNALEMSLLPESLSQAQATEHTTTVGCVMAANALKRVGRAASVVTTVVDDLPSFDRLERRAVALAAAGSLHGGTVLRIGAPIPGYTDVESTEVELAQLGLREHSVSRAALNAAVDACSDAAAHAVVEEVRASGWTGGANDPYGRDARLAAALQHLTVDNQALCGTVNCHGEMFRFNPEIGIAACFGVALLTAQGRPFACTGDQPTAIALYLMRAVSGAALYCESYAPEPATDLTLLVAGGEGDPAWCASGGAISLRPNTHYPGVHGPGLSLTFPPRLGPATLMSLSPMDGTWVLVWATGELVESRFEHLRGPNLMFRFDTPDVVKATTSWIGSGATHHNALGPGRLELEMPEIANALGIRCVRV